MPVPEHSPIIEQVADSSDVNVSRASIERYEALDDLVSTRSSPDSTSRGSGGGSPELSLLGLSFGGVRYEGFQGTTQLARER